MKTYLKLFAILLLTFITISTYAQPLFNRYRVAIFKGQPARVIIKGNELAEEYKTIITKTYKLTGINFAGHYCLVWWGCGSDCQHAAIIDVVTGVVYDGPTAANLFDYKKWSRLLIVNRSGFDEQKSCAFCKSEYWVWDEHRKKFDLVK